ncbi:MAG: hypothetical protein M1380_12020 [Chloroflexi bacterium]|nr:hypothetical protein [Chloroflexota bacterium]
MPLVDYLIAREGLPARRGQAYDYVLAGDGLYLAAENRYLEVRVPVATAQVRGLPPIYPNCTLRAGRLPVDLWDRIVDAPRLWSLYGREVLLAVTFEGPSGYRFLLPQQVVGPENIFYRPPSHVVLQIHSHRNYPAHFSPTDDADEQGLCLYGVLGKLDGDCPEVALRVGAYGYFLPVPWDSVFDGDLGVFRDVNFDPIDDQEPMEVGDGLQD